MDPVAVAEGARLLIEARRSGKLAERFPLASRSTNADEASQIQQAIAIGLGEKISGLKVTLSDQHGVVYGAILSSRLFSDGASVAASLMPTLGVEAEIAFRCERAFAPRAKAYERSEIEESVTALVGIEVLHSRFRDPSAVPMIERAADSLSNGGFVHGDVRPDWRRFDLAALRASVLINDRAVVSQQVGGHVNKDPLVPLIALVNVLRLGAGLDAGQIVTTGTYTGITHGHAGDRVRVLFEDFGAAEVHFT
jgi:2-keto-4-pentenoate hydratase